MDSNSNSITFSNIFGNLRLNDKFQTLHQEEQGQDSSDTQHQLPSVATQEVSSSIDPVEENKETKNHQMLSFHSSVTLRCLPSGVSQGISQTIVPIEDHKESRSQLSDNTILSHTNSGISEEFIENNEVRPLNSTIVKNITKKRKIVDSLIIEDLKKVKRSIEEANQYAPTVTIKIQKTYTPETRKKVVKLMKQIEAAKLSRLTGVSETSARRWSRSPSLGAGQKAGRKPCFVEAEEELFKIFIDLRAQNLPVSNSVLVKEARRIASEKKIKDFTGSCSWLEGFKKEA